MDRPGTRTVYLQSFCPMNNFQMLERLLSLVTVGPINPYTHCWGKYTFRLAATVTGKYYFHYNVFHLFWWVFLSRMYYMRHSKMPEGNYWATMQRDRRKTQNSKADITYKLLERRKQSNNFSRKQHTALMRITLAYKEILLCIANLDIRFLKCSLAEDFYWWSHTTQQAKQ